MATEIAWAAGFFDGEGCVTRTRNRYDSYYLHMGVSQSGDDEKLKRFLSAVRFGKVYGPHRGRPDQKPRYAYWVTGQKAYLVFDILRPYLTGDKIARFEELVSGGLVVPRKI